MFLLQEFRARSRHVVGPLLGILAVGYFGYHVVHGDRGLIAWWNIKQRVVSAKQALAVSRAERKAIEHRVSLMEPGSLDPDMLEERARMMLNYGHVDDIVILEDHKRRK
ncbi:MAG: septum formation initiator family protein [Alphaproteobacteria bacterium]|jgi:cell division protein FtsB|nr:septum formation initiator family protein [Alphaproteobacteria bacterium]MBT7944458.1 septum formation initiator family protein [Alphaproteobacteria bacterium]